MADEQQIMETFNFTPSWWTFVLIGLMAIIFGSIAWAFTGIVMGAFALLFGAAILIFSVGMIIQALKGDGGSTLMTAVLLIFGVIGIIIGILGLLNFWTLILAVGYFIAIWAFMLGISNIMLAFSGHDATWYKVLLFIAGIIAFLLGIYAATAPLITEYAVIQVLGIFAVAYGIVIIITGLVMHSKIPE